MNVSRSLATVAAMAALLFCGCSRQVDTMSDIPRTSIDRAKSATQPQPLTLTNQTLVYECSKCGTDYDKPGQCPADQTELTAMQVSYICPADNQPVDGAGKCPRCQMNARIDKVALNGSGGGTP
jgi:hypothetical protein